MRIAVDAMGGDFAPRAVVAGALQAAREVAGLDKLFLVGRPEAIQAELPPGAAWPAVIEIVPAAEVVEMGEAPAVAIRRKKDSSLGRCADMVKDGQADAFFSAGNTGAAVAASTLKMRLLPGVLRPGIATVIPTRGKYPAVLLDAGAVTDCTPDMLVQFAFMGEVYAREVIGAPQPRIGLLSIGEEDSKGNETTKEAFRRLKASGVNFAGNTEPRELFSGNMQVVVCDGFVGNIVLKTSESVARFMKDMMRAEFMRNPIRKLGALLLRSAFDDVRRHADPESHGGAPLLGVDGITIIGHGSSSPRAIFNGIRVAAESVRHHVKEQIAAAITRVPNV